MSHEVATLFAIAAAMLTATPPAHAFAPELPFGRLCAAHPMSIPLPFPQPRRDERHDCPGACHAACTRSARDQSEEDSD